ncbi:CoA transferase [Cognatiyoonia sp. IB215182]|uniref:CaiB/BaiF CoA transferase family protein n=1 Tax=Cognatiyoonia sp. IB215182 TaxID=3097353 RepID=UPI002A0E6D9B|nr:CoA transferase [Cognatiyoonia sp. IB215182]MDX8352500.1 CoA transferase [Cognatiyoonia sp. IB215182]
MAHSDAPDAATTAGALSGVIVLDLSRILAGPTATQLMGDLGATVIKIENPKTGGDDTRTWGPPYVETIDGESDLSAYFIAANRNKYSVSADLSTAEGQALVKSIAAEAHIVVENYKPGGLAKYGLDYPALREINPGLVYCSISGFGQTGPNKERPGYDLMAQGFGGLMSLTGDPDGPPMKVGVGIADVMCGMYAAVGILAALRHSEATGEGQHIDLALVDSQMAWLINEGTNYLVSGQSPVRRGNGHPNIVPYSVFACADGHVILAVGNDTQFQDFCAAIGRDDLGQDSRFATNPLRITHREAIEAAISETFANMTRDEILVLLQKAGVPCGPINGVAEALTSDQAVARNAVVEIPEQSTAAGVVKLLGNPLKLSKTPVVYAKSPPRFGQDTEKLAELLGRKPR